VGLFEQYPWLLVPLIIVTVEGWSLFKAFIRDGLRRRREQQF